MKPFLVGIVLVLVITVAAGLGIRSHIVQLRLQRDDLARSLKRSDYSVTIPEGWRREQIAALLDTDGICTASAFLAASTDKEGYLFPDTYRFYHGTSATEVVATMTADFTTRTATLTPSNDQLILASIVEREAGQDSERATIAGIYSNRLKLGMALEADPTVQYARDNRDDKQWINNPMASTAYPFWSPITQADYHSVASPYNTYLNVGLPPGPIANPGLKSIAAAMNPEKNPYYYFFQRNGKTYLSKTLAEHQAKLATIK